MINLDSINSEFLSLLDLPRADEKVSRPHFTCFIRDPAILFRSTAINAHLLPGIGFDLFFKKTKSEFEKV